MPAPDKFEKDLEKYEESVRKHVEKVNLQLDEQLSTIRRKISEKKESVKKLEEETRILEMNEEKMKKEIDRKTTDIIEFEKNIEENSKKINENEEKIGLMKKLLPEENKKNEELLNKLNLVQKNIGIFQDELSNYKMNRTEQSLKNRLEKIKNKLEDVKKTKIVQDKKIDCLRDDIKVSEKSYDTLESEIRREIVRQLESESKKNELERRVKIFEYENWGIQDEFQKLLKSLNEEENCHQTKEQQKIAELELLILKSQNYIREMNEKMKNGSTMNISSEIPFNQETNQEKIRSLIPQKSEPRNWKKLNDQKREILQLKREFEALEATKKRQIEQKQNLEKILEEKTKEADKFAFELRNAENIRLSELNQKDRKMKPSILIVSKVEKKKKAEMDRKNILKEKIERLEKSNGEQKMENDRLSERTELLNRRIEKLEIRDLEKMGNNRLEKETKVRKLKKQYHENIMKLNALQRKLQQRVYQREAAITQANSVVHLSTNIRSDRLREIDVLKNEIEEKQGILKNFKN